MSKKICKICSVEKDYIKFHKMKGCIGGVRNTCKECRKIEKKEYSSRDYVIEKNKDYYQKHKIQIRKRTNKHYWTLNGQYHQYKKRGKIDKIEFNLTQEDCIPYYNTNCYYCNSKINGLGIDRLNPKLGYLKNNIVPCCSRCNYMKSVMQEKEFIEQMIKILKNLKIM